MSFTQSRSALPVTLEQYEVQALIDWHMDQEFRAADDSRYTEADGHRRRREAMKGALEAKGAEMRAEALEQTKKNLAL